MAHPRRYLSRDLNGSPNPKHSQWQKESVYIMQNARNIIGSVYVTMNSEGETTVEIQVAESADVKVIVY